MTQSQEDNPTIPKNLDIFQHLKLNIKNELENCKCQSDNTFYCIPCKVSVCERCNLDNHRKHICNYNILFRLRNVYLIQKLIHNNQLFVRYFCPALMNIYLLSYHPISNMLYCLHFGIPRRKIISIFRRNNNLLFSMRNNKTIICFV